MTDLAIIAAAVLASGVYLRWALVPVAAAFRLGRRAGRIHQQ